MKNYSASPRHISVFFTPTICFLTKLSLAPFLFEHSAILLLLVLLLPLASSPCVRASTTGFLL